MKLTGTHSLLKRQCFALCRITLFINQISIYSQLFLDSFCFMVCLSIHVYYVLDVKPKNSFPNPQSWRFYPMAFLRVSYLGPYNEGPWPTVSQVLYKVRWTSNCCDAICSKGCHSFAELHWTFGKHQLTILVLIYFWSLWQSLCQDHLGENFIVSLLSLLMLCSFQHTYLVCFARFIHLLLDLYLSIIFLELS